MEESWNEKEWVYFAEGGLHIVFQNINKESLWYHYVLKVPKDKNHHHHHHDGHDFVQHTILPWFTPRYIGKRQTIELSISQLDYLQQVAVKHRCRSRQKTESICQLLSSVYIEPHFCHLPPHSLPLSVLSNLSSSSSSMVKWFDQGLTCEVKVKCGLPASSPFLSPHPHPHIRKATKFKLEYNKFSWMQQWKELNCKRCGSKDMPWGELEQLSTYCPHDLCSGNTSRVLSSLQALLTTPQNNLKVSIHDQHIYGWDKDNLSELYRCLALQTGNEDGKEVCTFVMNILSIILSREELLHRLERLQLMDFLDTEGGYEVYTMLEERLGLDELHKQLASHCIGPTDLQLWKFRANIAQNALPHLFPNSVDDSNDQVEQDPLGLFAQSKIMHHTTIEEHEKKHQNLRKALSSLDVLQLLELLKMAMAAMIAKDASVLTSVRFFFPTTNVDLERLSNLNKKIENNEVVISLYPQEVDTVGVLEIHLPLTMELVCRVEYRMGLIDVALKSWTKFKTNFTKEQEMIATLLHDQCVNSS
eukprot:gene766-831_t